MRAVAGVLARTGMAAKLFPGMTRLDGQAKISRLRPESTDYRNVVHLEAAAWSKDGFVDSRMGDICAILMWSAAMYKSGRMPRDVAEAFHVTSKRAFYPCVCDLLC